MHTQFPSSWVSPGPVWSLHLHHTGKGSSHARVYTAAKEEPGSASVAGMPDCPSFAFPLPKAYWAH